ncbi:hypothetical protein GN244_ATG16227 [Phytophthora infestans]|uniref:Uncharacterized protein n=1 Tax=Phytophthora infestans TaxID=4787 RepID=A0A833SR35_PHYIN|nr:hypothetical protein GN244_ATG16227 [Phytophthora infestans]
MKVTVKMSVKTDLEVRKALSGGMGASVYYGGEPLGYIGGSQGQAFVDKTEMEPLPQDGPSGFIPRYTGSEERRSDRPAFGWNWSAAKGPRKVENDIVQTDPYSGSAGMKGAMESTMGQLWRITPSAEIRIRLHACGRPFLQWC